MADRRPFFSFIDLKFFKMHPLLKPHNLFYSNGVGRFHEVLYGTIVQVFRMIPYFFKRKSEINFGIDNR